MSRYNPEIYWSRVGKEIQKRGENYIAGHDNPYFRYKRKKFLVKFLDTIDFKIETVLEVGFGPGGNIKRIAKYHKNDKILGIDISQTMFEIASQNLDEFKDVVKLYKINGKKLPFEDQSIDLSFSVTVLQHNTDEEMFRSLVQEICRVTKKEIVIIEDIGENQQLGGEGSYIARQVSVYKSIFSEYGFRLSNLQFLNTKISRSWYRLIYRRIYKRLVNRRHKTGEPIGVLFKLLIGIPIILTRYLDEFFTDEKDLAKMVFHKV